MKIGDRIFVRGYIDEIRKDTVIVRNDGGYFGTILSEVMGELPSAQPERIKGHWVEIASSNHTYKCSVCGRLLVNITDGKNNVAKNYPYCHCGADMRGEQDEDLISRKAAIDAIRASTSKYTGFMEMEMYTDDDAVEAIEALPSAQPEQRWIPCSERLPEPDERVLVYTVANEYHVWDAMPHRGEGYEWEDEEGLYHSLYEVAMWLPLPEPYAERRQNG